MNIVMALDRSRHARAVIQLLQRLRWPAGSPSRFSMCWSLSRSLVAGSSTTIRS